MKIIKYESPGIMAIKDHMKYLRKIFFLIAIFIMILPVSATRSANADARDIIKTKIQEMDNAFALGIDGYQNRSDIKDVERSLRLCLEAVKYYPNNYELLWRTARSIGYYTECAFGLQIEGWEDACIKWGRIGEEYALRAQNIEPGRVEACFWKIFCISGYGRAINVISAISGKIHIKLQECILGSYKMDKTYFDYFPVISLALYYYSLPWPLCDNEKAFKYLNEFLSNAKTPFMFQTRSVDCAEIMISTKNPELVSQGKEIIRTSAANSRLAKHYREKALRLMKEF